MLKLRIHHIFDIIRDLGANKTFEKHSYDHSYHKVAKSIIEKNNHAFKIVVSTDDICKNCIKLEDNKCTDDIFHRKDFSQKEKFNDYLDNRINKILNLKENETTTLKNLINIADKYIENIEYIYDGNDEINTKERKINVINGIAKLKNIIA